MSYLVQVFICHCLLLWLYSSIRMPVNQSRYWAVAVRSGAGLRLWQLIAKSPIQRAPATCAFLIHKSLTQSGLDHSKRGQTWLAYSFTIHHQRAETLNSVHSISTSWYCSVMFSFISIYVNICLEMTYDFKLYNKSCQSVKTSWITLSHRY